MCSTEPSPDQLTALQQFANDNGRYWRTKLRHAWLTGIYRGRAIPPLLQQVRNELGPTWLLAQCKIQPQD